jgi:hypothetical protein
LNFRSQEFSRSLSLIWTKFIEDSSLHVILAPANEGDQSSRGGERIGGVCMRQWVSGEEAREVSPSSGQGAGAGHPFDDLARSLGEGNLSRRRALRLFGAALVGMVMASVPGMASAAPCPPERKCKRRCCPEPLICVGGECVCPTGRNFCPGGTLQGTDTCCPEGYSCCAIPNPEGGGNLSSICCPTVGSVCHRGEDNLLSCVPV